MLYKKYMLGFVFLFIFLAMSFNGLAVPPVQTTLVGSGTTGLVIEYIEDNNFKIDTGMEYHFHVYNLTNGVLMTGDSGISCQGHMHSKDGKRQTTLTAETYNEGWYFNASGGNFTEPGLFPYQIHCNDSVKGGFVSGTIILSQSGEETTEQEAMIMGFLFFVIIIIWILCLIGHHNINDKNEYDIGGGLMSVNFNKYIKLGLGFASYLFSILVVFMAWKMSLKFLTFSFAFTIFETMFTILWISVPIVFIVYIVVTFVKVVADMKLQDLADRNLKPYGGKRH